MKKPLVVLAVVALTLAGTTLARAFTPAPYGAVRGVVAVIGDSNGVYGSTIMTERMTPSSVGYVPIIAAANGASVRWNGCTALPPCPDPTYTRYWTTRIAALRQRVNPDAYVIELGINDTGTEGTSTTRGYGSYTTKVSWLMALLPTNRPVIWTTLPCNLEPASKREGCLAVNEALRASRARWPNLTVPDWAGVASGHPEYMVKPWSDVHYSAAGFSAYATYVIAALNTRLR